MSQDNFRRVLLAAIDQGLSSLGDTPKAAIFFHLESSFQLKKDDIPLNLTEFKEALEKIFGPGAPYIEKLILKSLYERLGLDFDDVGTTDLVLCTDDIKKRIKSELEVNIK